MSKQMRDENSNEDGPSNGEKPLKKARYVWEVKGKHHLKELHKIPINNNNNEGDCTEKSQENNVENTSAVLGNNNEENNLKPDQHHNTQNMSHIKCCNSCCIQKLIEGADEIMTAEPDEISNEIPLTLVTPNPKNEEYYLRKWQARQIARGFVDNTINSVLETYSNRPLDVADMLDNYTNDGQVEDDAILMAIQSHGLQSSSRLEQPSGSSTQHEMAQQRNLGIEEFTHDNLENVENERIKEQGSESTITNEAVFNGSNNEASQESSGVEETMDFLSTAVSVAIQKKGLSYGY